MEFRILDLFCGAGGMSYGMHQNRYFSTKVALDIDDKLAQTFKKNIPNSELIIGDIRNENIKKKIIRLSQKYNVNMILDCWWPTMSRFLVKRQKFGVRRSKEFFICGVFAFGGNTPTRGLCN